MNNIDFTYLPKTTAVLNKIQNFEKNFSENSVAPEYAPVWEINRQHGMNLNPLKPESALFLYDLIKSKRPKTILEIGTGGAYSTLVMADCLEQLSLGGKIFTIEKSLPKIAVAMIHIKESELTNITLVEGDTREVLTENEILDNELFDLIFIDADRQRYKVFLNLCEARLNDGAIIVADNITSHPDDVVDFLQYIKESPHYKSEILNIGSGLLVATFTKPSSKNVD